MIKNTSMNYRRGFLTGLIKRSYQDTKALQFIYFVLKTYHFENGLNVDHVMVDYKEEEDVAGSNHYSFENNACLHLNLRVHL